MNQHLQHIWNTIQQEEHLSVEQKEAIVKWIKSADRELEIVTFKLDRTEKVKRTTAILLEETILELEQKRKAVEESKLALEKSLIELKATQAQLVHAEKMASLGELTAGIAHEIQNPLNFVNNFSEVNRELIEELRGELNHVKTQCIAAQQVDINNIQEAEGILNDLESNQQKINHHGKRADAIVKGMLAHSRTSSGKKEPTDLNALAEEYLRLSYHARRNDYVGQGLKAKDASFAATFHFEPDKSLPKVNVVPQDIGRMLLNLINNAFYAVQERGKHGEEGYQPQVVVSAKHAGNHVEITVCDNGNGIPDAIKDKILQPFFTTKPTGEGTGLGLSLSYDIVKAHGGELKVETKVGAGSTFIIQLPIV